MTEVVTEPLAVRVADGVRTWTMQSGPVNALSPQLLAALSAALDEAQRDETTAVVVLASALRVFSAGADASWMSEIVAERGTDELVEEFNRTMDDFRDVCVRMRRSPLLFVAAIGGHALAGGLELAAACDLRFCADVEKIQLGVPEMQLFGVMPSGGGGVQFLSRLMGPSRALRFVLDGTPIAPGEAERLGLLDRVCEPDRLLVETDAFATGVARRAGRIGTAAAKRAILGGAELPLYEAMELDRSLHWDAMRRGNFRAGVEAFVERFGGKG